MLFRSTRRNLMPPCSTSERSGAQSSSESSEWWDESSSPLRGCGEASSPEGESSSDRATEVDVESGVCVGVGLTPVLRGTELLAVELLAVGELLEVEVDISEVGSLTAACGSSCELRSPSVSTSAECVELEERAGKN